jgi:flagellin-like protein
VVPEHLRFGGGAADSAISPVVALWLLIAIVLILTVPRAKVITSFLLAFFTIPIEAVVVVGGFHFTALRILILAGLFRRAMLPKSTLAGKYPGGFNTIDWAVIIWAVLASGAEYLQFLQMPALVNALGSLLDTLGGYMVVRSFIPDGEGVRRTIKALAVICAIQGVCMINEKISRINVFGLLGGISTSVTIRDGHVRASGTFGCLYAGAFAGVLIPLFLWLWSDNKKSRTIAIVGFAGATAMVVTSYSSTSWMAYGGGFLGLGFWQLRKHTRVLRWAFSLCLIALHLVMKAPVWALIARVDLTGSSSGEQRYLLVDMTVKHFSDWWVMGTPKYMNWGWDSWDLCNQFVAVALTGGLLTLIFYIAIFSRSFGGIGRTVRQASADRKQQWLLWCFGSTLFATVIAHFGINYMAQLIMGFFALVACISVVTFEARKAAIESRKIAAQEQPAPAPDLHEGVLA